MRDASGLHLLGDHSFLIDESIGDLDRDLVRSLVALNTADNAVDEINLPSGPILASAIGWFVAGVVLWAAVGIYI